MVEWIAAAYDKLALFVVLFVLLLSVILLGIFVDLEKKHLAAAGGDRSDVPHKNSKPVDTSALHDAIESLVEPFQLEPATGRLMVAEPRVACDKCGRPIPAEDKVCPYKNCGAEQQKTPVVVKPLDSENDLMPDALEEKYGLDTSVNDARQDKDGDRWTNLEELNAGTSPADSSNHPPAASKLRWTRIQWTILPYSFQSVIQSVDGTMFVLKNKPLDHDYYVKVGDAVEGGYEVVKFEPKTKEVLNPKISAQPIVEDVSVLTLRKGDKLVELTLGQDAQRGELAAELIYLVDKSKHTVKANIDLSLENEKYKVVDIQKSLVVVSNISTGAKTTLEKYSESDRRGDAESLGAGRQDAAGSEARDN